MRLTNKKIIITGGGSGIGRAGVLLFAKEGAEIMLIDHDATLAAETVALAGGDSGRVRSLIADLSDLDRARIVIDEATALLGGLDGLWCNAGIVGGPEIDGLMHETYRRMMAINQDSVILSCSAALPYLRTNGGGSIVVTSSSAGLVGVLGSPTYSASKFGVIGWAKSLALRTAADGIRVNAICPGPIMTPLMRKSIAEGAGGVSGAEYEARVTADLPMRRFGEAEEIAQAALWLSSDELSYVTGIALPVDGGYTCR